MKKYELTEQTKEVFLDEIVLRRIRALQDIPRHGVKAGDLGGWVQSESNLSQEGDCWVGDNAQVCERALVCEDAGVFGTAQVFDDARVMGRAEIAGCSIVKGGAIVGGDTGLLFNAIIASTHDYLIIGPMGSRTRYTTFYRAESGICVRCGLFNGEIESFKNEVKRTHGDNEYAKEYMDAIEFVYKRFQTI